MVLKPKTVFITQVLNLIINQNNLLFHTLFMVLISLFRIVVKISPPFVEDYVKDIEVICKGKV